MIWCVRTLASSLSSHRALASEASEDNSAVVTFKSRNLFRSSQALVEKVGLIYTVEIISKEITNYIWKVYILRIPLRFQLCRNFSLIKERLSLIRSYLKDLSFAYKVTLSKSSCLRTFHNFTRVIHYILENADKLWWTAARPSIASYSCILTKISSNTHLQPLITVCVGTNLVSPKIICLWEKLEL